MFVLVAQDLRAPNYLPEGVTEKYSGRWNPRWKLLSAEIFIVKYYG